MTEPTTDLPDNWNFYLSEREGHLASVLLNLALVEVAPIEGLPWLHRVLISLQSPTEDGLISEDEFERVEKLEDAVAEAVIAEHSAVSVGRITSRGELELHFYAPSDALLEATANTVLEQFSGYSATDVASSDPAWDVYFDELYPTREDYQQIMNRQLLETLQEQGDTLEKPREIIHWLFFPTEESRAGFLESINEAGFAVELGEQDPEAESDSDDDHMHEGDPAEMPYSVQLTREDLVDFGSINALTIELMELADEFQGEYDGFETEVVSET